MTASRFFYFVVSTGLMIGGASSVGIENIWITLTLFLCGVILMAWQIADSLWERHNDELEKRVWLTDSRTKFITAIGNQDSDTRSFLSLEWPELGVMDVEIKPALYILHHGMNTNILVSAFQRFLQDGDEREFADVRRYNEDKSLQEALGISREGVRKQWELATQYLSKKGYLYPNSAQGSHSFLWVTKAHYFRMVQWYIHGTASLPNLGQPQQEPEIS